MNLIIRIASTEYNANDPIEDRHDFRQLTSIKAFACAVYDGHGGWEASEYIKALLLSEIPKPGRVGSCALVTIIKNNKVYTANVGDCKGVIVSQNDKKEWVARKINHKLNANSPKEQERLRKQFPNDKDIVVCKKKVEGACYVKGMLMPTRAFGDFRLKYKEFYTKDDTFKGPYITHQPDIQIHEINKNDKYIIMASDGLWDEMKKVNIAKITGDNYKDKISIVQELFNYAFRNAAKNAKLTEKELGLVEPGKRRNLHDDITIICIDLTNQYASS
ncbi:protein phosphatase 2c, putative [Ichthyophthirius multifiliis]|uniref:Protein phosphatase 2c, putative n=1 Tax=Ichthyophthirius multifiliis TaxID=5932 RepID=G0QYK5_ICHMU|nr:protein phosphatase 2c, putative [Ichthyophthirius multifiliis]EGR29696.1 protein phosphatase 2c, putative [Ichthyophthirius multifiliis]|eukprot:XP_004030932.1 protein phosphatase 2c, putative [Ichthyophthirius multifiliis]